MASPVDYDDFQRRFDVSRETVERLEAYQALVKKWNPAINLVGRSTLSDFWQRHVVDSAQLYGIGPKTCNLWADLGSGGGMPGVVLAAMALELDPNRATVCIESDVRKATFLRTCARELDISLTVHSKRIDEVAPLGADILSARALAPLVQLLDFAERHLSPDGQAIFPKGATWRDELAESLETWRFSTQEYPSQTDPQAVILKIGDLRRV